MKRLLFCTLLLSTLLLCGCPPKSSPPPENLQAYARANVMWEMLPRTSGMSDTWRTATPNGWLVTTWQGHVEYIPDPEHKWLKTQ